jgi:hypothetical protein
LEMPLQTDRSRNVLIKGCSLWPKDLLSQKENS